MSKDKTVAEKAAEYAAKLEPCPLCGTPAEFYYGPRIDRCGIGCPKCGLYLDGAAFDDIAGLQGQWNSREPKK